MTPPKFNNSTRTNTIDSEVDEISKNSIKWLQKLFNEIKEDTNKCLNEFQENVNKLLSEIKKIMQDMTE
jgi:gas vesicle protein